MKTLDRKFLEIKLAREDAENWCVPRNAPQGDSFDVGYTHGFVAGMRKAERILGLVINE